MNVNSGSGVLSAEYPVGNLFWLVPDLGVEFCWTKLSDCGIYGIVFLNICLDSNVRLLLFNGESPIFLNFLRLSEPDFVISCFFLEELSLILLFF